MAKDEASTHRKGKSKRIIQKVMFLSAAARPRYDEDGNLIFDRKLGIWPFLQLIPAKRDSENRPKGTLELKPRSVDKETYKEFLLSKVFPYIFEKWLGHRPWKIVPQLDNAPAHVPGDDPGIVSTGNCGRTSIDLVSQPLNSPDLNILGLGLFNGLQSLQYKTSPSTIEELESELNKSYEHYEPRSIDNFFLTLNKVMKCIMREHRAHAYKMPHMKKSYHRNNGTPIEKIVCDESAFNSAMDALEQVEYWTNLNKLEQLQGDQLIMNIQFTLSVLLKMKRVVGISTSSGGTVCNFGCRTFRKEILIQYRPHMPIRTPSFFCIFS